MKFRCLAPILYMLSLFLFWWLLVQGAIMEDGAFFAPAVWLGTTIGLVCIVGNILVAYSYKKEGNIRALAWWGMIQKILYYPIWNALILTFRADLLNTESSETDAGELPLVNVLLELIVFFIIGGLLLAQEIVLLVTAVYVVNAINLLNRQAALTKQARVLLLVGCFLPPVDCVCSVLVYLKARKVATRCLDRKIEEKFRKKF